MKRSKNAGLIVYIMSLVLGLGLVMGPLATGASAQSRVAVKTFKDKTARGWTRIGDGMADMLTTALVETGRYVVLERQAIGDVLGEQDLGASGRIKKGTEAPIGELEGAQFLIYGAVTEFEPNYRGVGGGLALPRIGGFGIGGGVKQSYVAIDMRIVDTKTGRIVAVTKVEGKSTDFGALGGAVIGGGMTRMPVALGGWKKTPMEKAIRVCIQRAVEVITTKLP